MKPDRIYGLDLVRGLCAIGVMIYHYIYNGYGIYLAAFGTFTVYLFFTLSGFVLHDVYGRRTISESMLKNFYTARFFRIFPLYAAISTAIFAYSAITKGLSYDILSRFLLNITFLFGITNPGVTSYVAGGWSIGIEFAFYALFPILLLFKGTRTMGALTIGALIISQTYLAQTSAHSTPDAWWGQITQPVSFLAFFIGGVWASMVYQKTRDRFSVPLFVPLSLLAAYGFMPTLTGSTTTFIREDFVLWSIVVLGSVLITFMAASARHGTVSSRIATFLGEISFALYLLHLYVQGVISKFIHLPVPATLIISGVASIIAAKLVHDYWESPARLYGRKFAASQ